MKNTKISSIVFLLMVLSFVMNGQDTIFFKDKSIISSKIIEIGITEIQYRKFDNLAGPIYNVLKNSIKSIKYSNGEIDSVSFVDISMKEIVQIEKNQSKIGQTKLQLSGMNLYYEGSKLGLRKTNQLIKSNSLTDNQRNLIMEIKNVKQVGKTQKGIGTGLFITGFAVPAVVTVFSFQALDFSQDSFWGTIAIGALSGAIIRTTGQVFMKIGRNKAKAKKLEFLAKHTNDEFIY